MDVPTDIFALILTDLKTGRPEKDIEAWLNSQKQHYRPQLDAYAEMVARGLTVPKEKIEWAILFIALPRIVWQGEKINTKQDLLNDFRLYLAKYPSFFFHRRRNILPKSGKVLPNFLFDFCILSVIHCHCI